jgi:hypothetical protein
MFRRLYVRSLPLTLAATVLSGAFLTGVVFFTGCDKAEPPVKAVEATTLPSGDKLRDMIDAEVSFTLLKRDLNGEVNAAWQILHGVLGYGRDFEIVLGDKRVKALDWALEGGKMKGWVMRKDAGQPGITAVVEPGSKTGQGHPDQWLAIIAQCGVPSDQPMVVDGKTYAIKDLVTQSMRDIYDGKEASWTAISLSHYLGVDSEWEAGDGTIWTLERIVAMEAAADIKQAACGGTHRLSALTLSLQRYRQQHPDVPLARGWLAAQQRIDGAIETIREYQLPSGAFSTDFFVSKADSAETTRNLHASGHTLEFLALTLDPEELREPWVVRNVVYVCNLLRRTHSVPNLECGALYHAARGLRVYRERLYGPYDYFHSKPIDKTPTEEKQPEVAAVE